MLLSVLRKIACSAVGIGLLFNNAKFLLLVLLSIYQLEQVHASSGFLY